MEIVSTGMSFGAVLVALIDYEAIDGIRLPHWKEDVIVQVHYSTEHDDMTHPYLYVSSENGIVPWNASVVEMFSHEWQGVRI